ncbi:unnamed protein product [Adineta ricciae]|uniref:Uncharacterized protein n=1 Tax=Adineta ricciae TaxID=249248 RepID=A0A815QCQ1_ADIRI|nr:unnamed protein product [Adineta ricciae]
MFSNQVAISHSEPDQANSSQTAHIQSRIRHDNRHTKCEKILATCLATALMLITISLIVVVPIIANKNSLKSISQTKTTTTRLNDRIQPTTSIKEWTAAAKLNINRNRHTATVLQNEQLLITGGHSHKGVLHECELYDPSRNRWTLVANMSAPRDYHTASLLTNGLVLVTGRENSDGVLSTAELYDASTNTWTNTQSMTHQRSKHTATVLQDGKVLVAGG